MSIDDFREDELIEIYRRGHLTWKRLAAEQEKQEYIDKFKQRTNDNHFQRIVEVIFFQHTKAKNVEERLPTIIKYLGDYRKLLKKEEAGELKEYIEQMLNDKEMFRSDTKIRASIDNAKVFSDLVNGYGGSFNNYILHFDPWDKKDDYAGVDRLVADMQKRFHRFGPISPKHFLVHYGFPIIKPDSNILRTFHRIGLIDNEKDEHGAVVVARRIAEAAGILVFEIDNFVTLGMKKGNEVCGNKPECNREKNPCEIREFCKYWRDEQSLQ